MKQQTKESNMESSQKKLERVRKPRVQISYDIETEGAIERKELPFVVGVLGDYSGDPVGEVRPYKDRKFVEIDQDNFNGVLRSFKPGLSLKVENVLEEGDSQLAVDLAFESMDDFDPEKIVEQIAPLKKLLDTRNQLRDLLTKADRSEELEGILEKILKDEDALKSVAEALTEDGKE